MHESFAGLVFFPEGGRGMDSDKKATKVWRWRVENRKVWRLEVKGSGLKIER